MLTSTNLYGQVEYLGNIIFQGPNATGVKPDLRKLFRYFHLSVLYPHFIWTYFSLAVGITGQVSLIRTYRIWAYAPITHHNLEDHGFNSCCNCGIKKNSFSGTDSLRVCSIDLIPEEEHILQYSRISILSSHQRNDYSVFGIMDHSGNIDGCCTLAFVKEFLEESVSNRHDFNNDFLPLFLSVSHITATKSSSPFLAQGSYSFGLLKFHEFFHDFWKFSMA